MGKQKRSRQKFHNAAVKPKGDKKQDEDSAMEVRKINILFYILYVDVIIVYGHLGSK